jgi:hypothetical protein
LGEVRLEEVRVKVVKRRNGKEWFDENSAMARFSILAITFYLLVQIRSNLSLNTPKTSSYKVV